MERVRPLLRTMVMGAPLVLGGCVGGVIPGSDTADPSCVLLCAVQRMVTGVPEGARSAIVAPPPVSPGEAPPGSGARRHSSRIVARARAHPPRRAPVAQVSVQPRSVAVIVPSAQGVPVPRLPTPMAQAAPPPDAAARSLSQAIPGSVDIVRPDWQLR